MSVVNILFSRTGAFSNSDMPIIDRQVYADFKRTINDENMSLAQERQRQIDLVKERALITNGLPDDVVNIIKSHSFIYREKAPQDGNFVEYGDLFRDSVANGWNVNGKIFIQAPVWKSDNQNPHQLLDTFFHEIQHSRKNKNEHGSDLSSNKYSDFINAYKPLVEIFNERWSEYY